MPAQSRAAHSMPITPPQAGMRTGCERWSVIDERVSTGKSALVAQESSSDSVVPYFAGLAVYPLDDTVGCPGYDLGRKRSCDVAVDGLGPRPAPDDPAGRQVRVLGDLHDCGCSLQTVDAPEATRAVARLKPGVRDDVLVFLVALAIW